MSEQAILKKFREFIKPGSVVFDGETEKLCRTVRCTERIAIEMVKELIKWKKMHLRASTPRNFEVYNDSEYFWDFYTHDRQAMKHFECYNFKKKPAKFFNSDVDAKFTVVIDDHRDYDELLEELLFEDRFFDTDNTGDNLVIEADCDPHRTFVITKKAQLID